MKIANNISSNFRGSSLKKSRILYPFLFSFTLMFYLISCETYENNMISLAGPLSLSTTNSEITLNEKDAGNTALSFHWTTGTNDGAGSSISYKLQVDKKGNNFSSEAISFDLGKAVYTKSLTVVELNDKLLKHWSFDPEVKGNLEARVIATIHSTPEQQDISDVVTIAVVPYLPVSTKLYLIGDATRTGWDLNNATELTPFVESAATFIYKGAFSKGEFSFITTLGQQLPAYGKGTVDGQLVYQSKDPSSVTKFQITEPGTYKISLNLLDLAISISKWDEPAYSQIFIVGPASPNGWDITNATELVQDNDNPFIFTYTGVMNKGEFKFPVNRNGDWGQDMYMMVDDTHMYLHNGGDPDDNKWVNKKKGYYKVTLDLKNLTMTMKQTKLYFVGSATPVLWDIENAIEMVEDATDGCIFTYTGPMTAGEFKFPVNRNSDWAQDMYMKVDNSHMYLHHGGDEDDIKWVLTEAGNYIITANIELLTVDILKQ